MERPLLFAPASTGGHDVPDIDLNEVFSDCYLSPYEMEMLISGVVSEGQGEAVSDVSATSLPSSISVGLRPGHTPAPLPNHANRVRNTDLPTSLGVGLRPNHQPDPIPARPKEKTEARSDNLPSSIGIRLGVGHKPDPLPPRHGALAAADRAQEGSPVNCFTDDAAFKQVHPEAPEDSPAPPSSSLPWSQPKTLAPLPSSTNLVLPPPPPPPVLPSEPNASTAPEPTPPGTSSSAPPTFPPPPLAFPPPPPAASIPSSLPLPQSGGKVARPFEDGDDDDPNLSHLTAVERRERNREHAKKSRVRKKFMLESLQDQVSLLLRENNSLRQLVKQRIPDQAASILSDCTQEFSPFFKNADPLMQSQPVAPGMTPSREVVEQDLRLIQSLLSSQQNFTVSDPSLPDNPIVYCSPGFLKLTGYSMDEVLGRNCRFLQGPETDPRAVDVIRRGIEAGEDCSIVLLNYRKDGTPFWNQFFIAALKDAQGVTVNFVGVQCEVVKSEENPAELKRGRKRPVDLLSSLTGRVIA